MKRLILYKMFVKITPSSLGVFLVWINSWKLLAVLFQTLIHFRRIARPFGYISYLTRPRMPKSGRRYVTSMFAWSSNVTTHKSFKMWYLKCFHFLFVLTNPCCRWNIVVMFGIVWSARGLRKSEYLAPSSVNHMFCRNVNRTYIEPSTLGLKVYSMT
jgi:hypothetical protein